MGFLKCPYCGEDALICRPIHNTPKPDRLIRYRICTACGHKVRTVERYEWDVEHSNEMFDKLREAHRLFDGTRNLTSELNYYLTHSQKGYYTSRKQELLFLWIFDEARKVLEDKDEISVIRG